MERIVGVTAGTIRYWEERGLLCADRAENRYRTYTEGDLARIEKIKVLREIGIAIADIKLWCDGVVTEGALLSNHRRQLEADDRENRRLRELCDKLLSDPAGLSHVSDGTAPFSESDTTPNGGLLLGIDIGTTSISAQLLTLDTGVSLHTYNIDHGAALPADAEYGADAFAADANVLLQTVCGLVSSAVDSYPGIAAIGFAGQMHGIVCVDRENRPLSPLYTWQNRYGQRLCDGETFCSRMERLTGLHTPTGYGLVTYYVLKESGLLPEGTVQIACISDLAAAVLCGEEIRCHPTNAAALGFYDPQNRCFVTDALDVLGIPVTLLPAVAGDGMLAGTYHGIPVAVSVGDNQAGVLGSLADTGAALLNIGTSGQISRIVDGAAEGIPQGCEIRPYFDGMSLCSGATLFGGRALASLAALLGEIAAALGGNPTKQQIYDCINTYAMTAEQPLSVTTTFGGTRADPTRTGEITEIGTDNLTLAALSGGFCRGIVSELYTLCCAMEGAAPQHLVISGNALRRNPALRAAARDIFACPLMVPAHIEEAAFGAALYAGVSAGLFSWEAARKLIRYETENI